MLQFSGLQAVGLPLDKHNIDIRFSACCIVGNTKAVEGLDSSCRRLVHPESSKLAGKFAGRAKNRKVTKFSQMIPV